MKTKPKKYHPRFNLDEIEQLLNWYVGEFSGSKKLHNKLLRIKRKLADNERAEAKWK